MSELLAESEPRVHLVLHYAFHEVIALHCKKFLPLSFISPEWKGELQHATG